MNNSINIKIGYNELRNLLLEVYRSAVNSYIDLAEYVVDQKLSDLVSSNLEKNVHTIDFSLQRLGDSNVNFPAPKTNESTVITTQINENTSFTYYSSENTILNTEQNNLSLTFTSTGLGR